MASIPDILCKLIVYCNFHWSKAYFSEHSSPYLGTPVNVFINLLFKNAFGSSQNLMKKIDK